MTTIGQDLDALDTAINDSSTEDDTDLILDAAKIQQYVESNKDFWFGIIDTNVYEIFKNFGDGAVLNSTAYLKVIRSLEGLNLSPIYKKDVQGYCQLILQIINKNSTYIALIGIEDFYLFLQNNPLPYSPDIMKSISQV